MNSAIRDLLKTVFQATLLFGFIIALSMLTAVVAKPASAKTQPKSQTSKSGAKANQKPEPKSRPASAKTNRPDARPAVSKNSRNEKVTPRSVKPNAKEIQATHRNLKGKPTAAEARASRNPVQTSSSKKSRVAEKRAAEQRAVETRRAEARRQAEANRLAAIARQRAADQEMRDEVQAMIARDNTAGEDPEVRAAAVKALGNHAGTVVVMDPKTGRVYSMVNQEWAVRRGFKPCSTIKLVTGMAGLNEGVIDQSNLVNVSDSNHDNLTKALAYSRNEYFQQVGGRVGFDKMISYSRQLGLGEKTGINSPAEFKGQVPAPRSGSASRIYSHGDDFKVTPLQLATLVSAMANGGKLLTPRISPDANLRPKVRRVVNIQSNTLASMVPGMVGAVNYGSGRRAHHSGAAVAGKTGTCIEQGTWVGLFASYAPTVNPRLAVVVIARGPDARNHFPAAVAGRIYRDLNGRFGTPTYLPVASNSSRRNQVDEEKDPASNDEELEEERYNSKVGGSGKNAIAQTRATETVETPIRSNSSSNGASNNKVRRVLMTIPHVFEPARKTAEVKPTISITRPRRVSQM